MSEVFFQKYNNEIVRIVNVSMVLFALLVGTNIGSGSRDNEIKLLKGQIEELNEFIEVTNSTFLVQKKEIEFQCEQKINNSILLEKQNKEKAIDEYKIICRQTKCEK
jgi:hypothetical protein